MSSKDDWARMRAEAWTRFAASLAPQLRQDGAVAIAKAADDLLKEFDSRFQDEADACDDDATTESAVPFEAHVEGDTVTYESTRPDEAEPDTPLNL
jgi:hypothetical protein